MEKLHTSNLSAIDIGSRMFLAVTLLSMAFYNTEVPILFASMNIMSLYLLATALTAWDPVYKLISGIRFAVLGATSIAMKKSTA